MSREPVAERIAGVEAIVLATRRGRFHALAAGDPAHPAVLVLHGFPDAPPTFAALVAALASAGHRVVAPWLRGYAPSPLAGTHTIEELADDLAACLDALSPHAPAFVIGHDWGAVATYAASVRHRARIAAAVTLSVPHPLELLRRVDLAQLARSSYMLLFQLPGAALVARAADFAFIDGLWRRWSPGLRLPDHQRAALQRCLAASWPEPLRFYRALLRPPGPALRRIRAGGEAHRPVEVPTLYLHGTDDGCIGVEVGAGAEARFAGPYRRETIAGAGHFLAAEVPGLVAERAAAWFQPFRR